MLQLTNKREKQPTTTKNWWNTQDWGLFSPANQAKTSQQYINEDNEATDFYNMLLLLTSLRLAFLVLQSFVSLNSPSLFCSKNVLVKTKPPVRLPWALLPLIGKKHMILAVIQPGVTHGTEESTTEPPSLLQFEILPPQLWKTQQAIGKGKKKELKLISFWLCIYETLALEQRWSTLTVSVVLSWMSSSQLQIPSLTNLALEMSCQLIAAALTAREFWHTTQVLHTHRLLGTTDAVLLLEMEYCICEGYRVLPMWTNVKVKFWPWTPWQCQLKYTSV